MYDEFFTKAHELSQQGVPFATATVVRAERPTSGKPGDKAIVTLDGIMYGWIGGSCAQPAVARVAREAIEQDRGRLIRITPEAGGDVPEGVEEVAMECFSGGTLDIYIEPQQPRPSLVLFGDLPVAQALAHLGKAMGYRVVAVDPRGGGAMDHADEVLTDLEAAAGRLTPVSYVVVASHGHFDEEALARVLRTGVSYVGLVASRKRAQAIRGQLRERGLSEAQLARFKAPAGLDIQARRGDEIALSILAEVVQVRRTAERLAWTANEETSGPAEERRAAGGREGEAGEPAVKDGGSTCCHGDAGDSAA